MNPDVFKTILYKVYYLLVTHFWNSFKTVIVRIYGLLFYCIFECVFNNNYHKIFDLNSIFVSYLQFNRMVSNFLGYQI